MWNKKKIVIGSLEKEQPKCVYNTEDKIVIIVRTK